MPKLREGDIVTVKAVVTRVAPYDDDQQIMAKILPRGREIGWCVPGEIDFKPETLTLKVGDIARRKDQGGENNRWEIMAIFPEEQVAVRKPGEWVVKVIDGRQLERY